MASGGALGSPFCVQPWGHGSHLCTLALHTRSQLPHSIVPQAVSPALPPSSRFLSLLCAPRTRPPNPPILHTPLHSTSFSSRISQFSACSSTASPPTPPSKGWAPVCPKTETPQLLLACLHQRGSLQAPQLPFPLRKSNLRSPPAWGSPSPASGERTRRKNSRFFSPRLLDFVPKCRVCSCLHFFFLFPF